MTKNCLAGIAFFAPTWADVAAGHGWEREIDNGDGIGARLLLCRAHTCN